MNLDSDQPPRDALEARLTALLLGELSPEEAAAVRQAIAQDPELARLHERLKQTVQLVREAIATPEEAAASHGAAPKLSPERREKLLQHFKTVAPRAFAPERKRRVMPWYVPASIAAVLVVFLGGAVLLPTFLVRQNRDIAAMSPLLPRIAFFSERAEKPAEAKVKLGLDLALPKASVPPAAVVLDAEAPPPALTPPPPAPGIGVQGGAAPSAPAEAPTEIARRRGEIAATSATGASGAAGRGVYLPTSAASEQGGEVAGVAEATKRDGGLQADWFFQGDYGSAPLRFGSGRRDVGWKPAAGDQPGMMGGGGGGGGFTGGRGGSGSRQPTDLSSPQPGGQSVPSLGDVPLLGNFSELRNSAVPTPGSGAAPVAGFRFNDALTVNNAVAKGEPVVLATPPPAPTIPIDVAAARPEVSERFGAFESKPNAATTRDLNGDATRGKDTGGVTAEGERRGREMASEELAPLPMTIPAPTLKGVPAELPSGPNIEPLNETLGFGRSSLGQVAATVNQPLDVLAGRAAEPVGGQAGEIAMPAINPSTGLPPVTEESAKSLNKRTGALGVNLSDKSEIVARHRTVNQWGDSKPAVGAPAQVDAGQLAVGTPTLAGGSANTVALQPALPQEPASVVTSYSIDAKNSVADAKGKDRILKDGAVEFFDGNRVTNHGRLADLSWSLGDKAADQTRSSFSQRLENIVQRASGAPPGEVVVLGMPRGSLEQAEAEAAKKAAPAQQFGFADWDASVENYRFGVPSPASSAGGTAAKGTSKERFDQSAGVQRGNRAIVLPGQSEEPESRETLILDRAEPVFESRAEAETAKPALLPRQAQLFNLGNVEISTQPATAESAARLEDNFLLGAATEAKDNLAREMAPTAKPAESKGKASGTEKQLSALQQAGEGVVAVQTGPVGGKQAGGVYSVNAVGYVNIPSSAFDGEGAIIEIPKTGGVEIVDQADAQPDKSGSLWGRLRAGLGGNVERSARIAVDKDLRDVGDRAPEQGLGNDPRASAWDPYWLQTESEKIQSKAILDKVAKKLNLNEAWAEKYGSGAKLSEDEVYQRLKKQVNVGQAGNTSLLDIKVKSDKPDEAARIANTIAEVYRDSRVERRREMAMRSTQKLKEQLAEQDKEIAQVEEQLKRTERKPVVQEVDVPPPKPPPNAPIPQPEVLTTENAFSTFSLNVSDVSFKLASASLEKGAMPDVSTIRSEEFLNAFDYRDPEPPPGVPVAFAWERAAYPFAHNRDLLRFSVKTGASGRQPGRPLNLVLVLDNSGSMERADRVRIIQECLLVLASQLQPQDRVSVVTFARTARLWADGVPGNQAAATFERVGTVTPEGGTNLEDAMNLAYQTALRHYLAQGVNRIVLLTDGAANLGNVNPEALKQKVEAHRKQGIALDCFGIGWEGFNDDLLEVLSRNGDGRYGFVNTPEEAATEFAGQLAGALKVAASDVKVQVEFNPRRVTVYRQIGYAKHQLKKEQFRDNTVDAAEIAAAEAGNALYVVQANPRGEGPLAIVRVRYRVPGTADYREHEWAVPFTGVAVPLEQSSLAMRLAATASAFSEWLVSSPYAGEVTPDRLLGYLRGVPEVYGADARPKKLEWMMRQAKSIAGR